MREQPRVEANLSYTTGMGYGMCIESQNPQLIIFLAQNNLGRALIFDVLIHKNCNREAPKSKGEGETSPTRLSDADGMPKLRYYKQSCNLERMMLRRNRTGSICGSASALVVGGLFFFDIIGVFGLGSAVTGLIVFIVSSVGVFRFTALKGAEQ